MSNRSYCGPNKFPQNYRSINRTNEHDRYKLPAINNETATVPNMNSSSMTRSCISQPNNNYSTEFSNLNNTANTNNLSLPANVAPDGPALYNARAPSNNNYKINCPPRGIASSQAFTSTPVKSRMYNTMQQAPANRSWSSNQFIGFDKTNTTNTDVNKNPLINQNDSSPPRRPMTSGPGGFNYSSSNMNIANGQKTVVRDRLLANEILQKAGITSNLTPNDCLEVITDTPVTMNDNVNCDPNPLCMKKPSESQEFYEQSIVVRHLKPPRPLVPPPIIIREHYAQQSSSSSQSPIIIRQIPPRPSTPPPLIIRECPPPMRDLQEPTIIEREVPPPPRQVIVEQFPTPPPKPRSIILEKWLPYEEPEDRPCIVEKAAINEMPPPKNIIIQYEPIEPRIQPQCINEGISYVDPKQFVNDRPNGNAEVCYVDQLNNLPDHIKCQLSPQVLTAIGIQNSDKQNVNNNPYVVSTNPTAFYQQHDRVPGTSIAPMPSRNPMMANGCHSVKPSYSQLGNPNMYHRQQQQQPDNRAHSASFAAGSSRCYNKYNKNMLTRTGNQILNNLSRAHYNPWATTYQVSYPNKARGMCRAR